MFSQNTAPSPPSFPRTPLTGGFDIEHGHCASYSPETVIITVNKQTLPLTKHSFPRSRCMFCALSWAGTQAPQRSKWYQFQYYRRLTSAYSCNATHTHTHTHTHTPVPRNSPETVSGILVPYNVHKG
jgi:hypothetical protein